MPKKKYQNISAGLEKEKSELAEKEKYQEYIDDLLRRKFPHQDKPLHVREGISLLPEDVLLAKELRGRIISHNHNFVPSKSEIYRMGLYQLRGKTPEELVSLYKSII